MQNTPRSGKKTRILVLGSTGRTGKAVLAELEKLDRIQPVYASRDHERVEAWRREGKETVYLDLDDARTFPAALACIDRLFLSAGYTVAMVHQGKTIVDAAADAGVKFIVHLGIFGNGRMTDPHFGWHEIVERYIEGSNIR
jgi:NAD(P)H dehydrogenase (quinone)